MGWLRKTEDRALTTASVPPVMLAATPGGTVTPSSALAIGDVYACVRCLSDAAASIPLVAYRRTADGRTRADGRLADLLRRPAPATTQANLIGQAMAHLQLFGNCYFGKWRDAVGRVEQLALLHPERVVPELRAGRPVYTVADGHGRQTEHTTADVIHVRALSTDGLVGLSPIRQARQALGLAQSLSGLADSFARNSGRPSGILTLSTGASRDQVEALRASFAARHTGPERAGNTAVMTGDVAYESLALSMQDAEFVAQRNLSTAEVCRVFRVPPWMVGGSSGDSLTYSNVESQALAFVTHSLRPHLVLIEQAISEDPDLAPGSLYVEFLLDALLRADSVSRAEVYTRALDPLTGWMSRSEVRRLENLDPEPEPAPITTEIA